MAVVEKPGVVAAPPRRPAASVPRRVFGWFKRHFLSLSISAALLWVVGIPVVFVLIFSFLSGNPVVPGHFTLNNYQRAYGNPLTYSAFW